MASADPSILITDIDSTGRCKGWTLTTYALEFLGRAESLYGRRTSTLPFGGVQVVNITSPRIWYPQLCGHNYVVANLTPKVLEDRREAVFQLSHEMLHVLVTDGQTKTTNNLEEGVATHFSVLMTEDYALDRAYAERIIPNTAYAHPHKLIQELLAIEPDAIVRLRKVQPNLGLVTADDFDKAGLHSVPAALIQELIKLIDYSHPSQPTQ